MFQSKKMIKSNFFKQKLTIMGIPTFFRSIIQNNKAVIQGAVPDGVVDYLFIYFNSLVYNTWYRIHK